VARRKGKSTYWNDPHYKARHHVRKDVRADLRKAFARDKRITPEALREIQHSASMDRLDPWLRHIPAIQRSEAAAIVAEEQMLLREEHIKAEGKLKPVRLRAKAPKKRRRTVAPRENRPRK
jgi:hypothetical protein